MRTLIVAHDPRLSTGATVALAAIAARNGIRGDGDPMPGRTADAGAALLWIARETGLGIDAVRSAVDELAKAGHARRDPDGLRAVREALAERWRDHRRRIRLDEHARSFGLRATALVLVGLVDWHTLPGRPLRLGVEFLAERLGCDARAAERALAAARACDAITTWSEPIPGGGFRRQLFLARRKTSAGSSLATSEEGHRETSAGPIGKRRPEPSESDGRPHRKTSVTPIGKRRSTPGVPEGVQIGSPPDARAREASAAPTSEPIAPRGGAEPEAPATPATTERRHVDPVRVVELWLVEQLQAGAERLTGPAVAGLLGRLDEAPVRDAALVRERIALGQRVADWCISTELLARWLIRAHRTRHVANLGAYLRRACQQGDPGQLLNGRRRRRWRDLSWSTERKLEGRLCREVERIVAGGAELLAADGAHRDRLRAELRDYLAAGRRARARATLLLLVGRDRSELALQRACADVLTHTEARELLDLAS